MHVRACAACASAAFDAALTATKHVTGVPHAHWKRRRVAGRARFSGCSRFCGGWTVVKRLAANCICAALAQAGTTAAFVSKLFSSTATFPAQTSLQHCRIQETRALGRLLQGLDHRHPSALAGEHATGPGGGQTATSKVSRFSKVCTWCTSDFTTCRVDSLSGALVWKSPPIQMRSLALRPASFCRWLWRV